MTRFRVPKPWGFGLRDPGFGFQVSGTKKVGSGSVGEVWAVDRVSEHRFCAPKLQGFVFFGFRALGFGFRVPGTKKVGSGSVRKVGPLTRFRVSGSRIRDPGFGFQFFGYQVGRVGLCREGRAIDRHDEVVHGEVGLRRVRRLVPEFGYLSTRQVISDAKMWNL